MKQTLKILIALFLFGYGALKAQEIITPNGDYFSNSNGSLSTTIGEPITETFTGSVNVITQGFQQSKLTVFSVFDYPEPGISISAFPNPVKDYVKIVVKTESLVSLTSNLYDNSGKLILIKQLEGSETEISFSKLNPGTYFIKIILEKKEVKIFKIIKK
jgi:hypothetical protein